MAESGLVDSECYLILRQSHGMPLCVNRMDLLNLVTNSV